MSERQPKSYAIYLRVTEETKRRLYEVASQYGDPPDVIREVIEAFIDGRVTITPPRERKSLYVNRE